MEIKNHRPPLHHLSPPPLLRPPLLRPPLRRRRRRHHQFQYRHRHSCRYDNKLDAYKQVLADVTARTIYLSACVDQQSARTQQCGY